VQTTQPPVTTHTHTHTHTHTQHLNEQIAHLKDQLQELKAKTNLEAKYIKKETQVCTVPQPVIPLPVKVTFTVHDRDSTQEQDKLETDALH